MKKFIIFAVIIVLAPIFYNYITIFGHWVYQSLNVFYLSFGFSSSYAETSAQVSCFFLTFSLLYLVEPFIDFFSYLHDLKESRKTEIKD